MINKSELFVQTPHPDLVNNFFHTLNSSNVLNAVYWWEYFREINHVEGDIVECGVGRGRSLITLASINKLVSTLNSSQERKIFALDSFEGFPEPTEFDQSLRNPKKGEWSFSPNNEFKYSPDSLAKILEFAEVDSDIEFVKGFFDKTTQNLSVENIAILHLDGDLYDSVKSPLDNLWQKVSVGGLIVIDDYLFEESDNECWPGARKAVMDFLETNFSFEYLESIRGTPYLKRVK